MGETIKFVENYITQLARVPGVHEKGHGKIGSYQMVAGSSPAIVPMEEEVKISYSCFLELGNNELDAAFKMVKNLRNKI